MCGIGGILRTDGQPIPEEWLDIIDARIAYRGPDGCGRFRDRVEIDIDGTPALRAGSLPHFSEAPHTPGSENRGATKRIVEVAFVHRRLSIIDHAGGHQPMVSERGRNDSEGLVAVVFNGCIYNHRELRKELEGKGHTFVTDHSDTEVLIHGWREWGEALVDRLEGMYAFGVWNRLDGSLLMARDWFGEKPLYSLAWHDNSTEIPNSPKVVAFSSDAIGLSALQLSNEVSDSPTMLSWAGRYLHLGHTSSSPHPWRCDGAVGLLEPGSFVRTASSLRRHRSFREISGNHRASDNREGMLEPLIEAAVARRLEADVPLGCFLSGGVDSSLVSLFARRHKPDVVTFTVRMSDDRYDESRFASQVAQLIGTDHRTLEAAVDPADDLVRLIAHLGQPFGDSSILPTYWVSRAARRELKVALSGDGGDELFVGYERYLVARRLARHHRWLRIAPVSGLERLHPKSILNKIGRLKRAAQDFHATGLASLASIFSVAEIHDLIEDDRIELDYIDSASDPLASLRRADIESYLPDDLLRKVDTASMACGLEVRCPFLDRDLARAALSMPIEQLMPGGQRKGLLRNIARKYLPKEIVDRPKMGFAIPIGEWFRSDYGSMKTLLLDHLNSAEPFGPISLNRKAVQRFIDEHMSGKRDHGQRLFTLLTLSIWARQVKAGCRNQKAEIA